MTDTKRLKRSAFLAIVMMLILLSVMSMATYAWFSENREVQTNRLTAQTASVEMSLQMSNTLNGAYSDELILPKAEHVLYPLSTADLSNFAFCIQTELDEVTHEDYAAEFFKLNANEAEAYMYAIDFYIRATCTDILPGETMKIYVVRQGEAYSTTIAEQTSGSTFFNAARLGVVISGADMQETTYIYRFEDDQEGMPINTRIGDNALKSNAVLTWDANGNIQSAADPSKNISTVTYAPDQPLPSEYFMELSPNETYHVRMYIYLEGCDPDCVDSVQLDNGFFGLTFFGVRG